ncbi:MAG TPA: citrate synthase [Acidimicrobiia bacterium]|nr:citrate synthase [Acidimicrobiia bacterium]
MTTDPPPDAWLTAPEATERLGVKRETLYAYVSRGLIRSERVPGSRTSRFLRSDVERMAARDPVRRGAGRLDVVVDSALTRLEPAGRLYFRGHDVVTLARVETYERTASLLWTGTLSGPTTWVAPADAVRVGTRAQRALPASAGVTDRLHVVAAAVRAVDALRDDRSPGAVVEHGRQLVATLVDALPSQQERAPLDASIAARLWIKLSPLPPTRARVDALDDALVLLADHELAASTLAARVAASTWADPYLVVLAGMSAAGGPLHGGASRAVRALLAELRSGVPPETAIAERLRQANAVPGTGHPVYEGPDPRCDALLDAIALLRPPKDLRAAMSVITGYADRRGVHPNVDFALGAFTEEAEMVPDAGEAVYLVARSAGWIAHALEEYRHRLRFRPRAVYTGPPPVDG